MILARKNSYNEDISTLNAGTNLISDQCAVYSITVVAEADGDAIVNFADGLTYSSTNRKLKACLTAENHTVHLSFPGGKLFTTGLSATSNVGGVDIAVTYE